MLWYNCAETRRKHMANIDVSLVAWLLIGAWAIWKGLGYRKMIDAADKYKDYTEESVVKFARYFGTAFTALGVFFVIGAAIKFFNAPFILSVIVAALLVITGIAMGIIYKTVLVKRGPRR